MNNQLYRFDEDDFNKEDENDEEEN